MILRDRIILQLLCGALEMRFPTDKNRKWWNFAKILGSYIRLIDPTRPITSAVNDLRPDKDPYFATLDVAGYNYASGGDHNQKTSMRSIMNDYHNV